MAPASAGETMCQALQCGRNLLRVRASAVPRRELEITVDRNGAGCHLAMHRLRLKYHNSLRPPLATRLAGSSQKLCVAGHGEPRSQWEARNRSGQSQDSWQCSAEQPGDL